jgi:hypothetical protein
MSSHPSGDSDNTTSDSEDSRLPAAALPQERAQPCTNRGTLDGLSRNAAAGARLIHAEAFDSKLTADVSACLADALESNLG